MSTDYYSKLYMGVLVESQELWDEVTLDPPECPRGHSNSSGALFCSTCGKGLVTSGKAPGLVLRTLGITFNMSPEKAWEQLTTYNSDWQLVPAAAVQNNEGWSGEKLWVFGRKLASVDTYFHKKDPSLSMEEVLRVKQEILNRIKGTTLESREVRLFPVLYISC